MDPATALDPATAARLARLLDCDVAAARSLGGQHGVRHYRLELADGRSAFAKLHNPHPAGNGLVPSLRRSGGRGRSGNGGPGSGWVRS